MASKGKGTKGSSDRCLNGDVHSIVEGLARDATVGAGNLSEDVDYSVLDGEFSRRLNRAASDVERRVFAGAWQRSLQNVAQP